MLTSKRGDLLNLGRGDVPGKDAAYPHALSVDLEHDSRGTFAIHAEIFLQDDDDEIHRRVIVIQQQDLVHRWRTSPCPLCFQNEIILFSGAHKSILTMRKQSATRLGSRRGGGFVQRGALWYRAQSLSGFRALRQRNSSAQMQELTQKPSRHEGSGCCAAPKNGKERPLTLHLRMRKS